MASPFGSRLAARNARRGQTAVIPPPITAGVEKPPEISVHKVDNEDPKEAEDNYDDQLLNTTSNAMKFSAATAMMKSSRISVRPLLAPKNSFNPADETPELVESKVLAEKAKEGKGPVTAPPQFKNLFEEFFIVGLDKDELIKIDEETDNKVHQKWVKDPRVLYSFPQLDENRDWFAALVLLDDFV
jgi:hypothetical protein